MLKRCCTAALCTALLAHPAWGQDKPAAATSKAVPKSATGSTKSRAAPQQGAAAEADSPGVMAVEAIFACVAQGLPDGWQRAWVIVTELSESAKGRTFEARYQVSLEGAGESRWNFVPCNARDVAERVYGLNDFLEPGKRQWKVATLLFTQDGKFELKYDYTR